MAKLGVEPRESGSSSYALSYSSDEKIFACARKPDEVINLGQSIYTHIVNDSHWKSIVAFYFTVNRDFIKVLSYE